MKPILTGS